MAMNAASINFEDENDGLRYVTITGRLDIHGTDAIDAKFAAIAASSAKRVVVDLTGVDFLASIGIRCLISNGKAQHQRGGRLVLFVGDNAPVAKVLHTTGIDTVLPMLADANEARKAALA